MGGGGVGRIPHLLWLAPTNRLDNPNSLHGKGALVTFIYDNTKCCVTSPQAQTNFSSGEKQTTFTLRVIPLNTSSRLPVFTCHIKIGAEFPLKCGVPT